MADALQNRSENNQLIKQIVDAQRINNYSSEYERTQNRVHNSATPALNRDSSTARKADFKSMGAKAVDTIHSSVDFVFKNGSASSRYEQAT